MVGGSWASFICVALDKHRFSIFPFGVLDKFTVKVYDKSARYREYEGEWELLEKWNQSGLFYLQPTSNLFKTHLNPFKMWRLERVSNPRSISSVSSIFCIFLIKLRKWAESLGNKSTWFHPPPSPTKFTLFGVAIRTRSSGGGTWFNYLPPFPSRIRGRRPYPTWSFIRKFVEVYMSISK